MMPLSIEENESYQEVRHIRKKEFSIDFENRCRIMFTKYRRVRDHCRYTGKYRGAIKI